MYRITIIEIPALVIESSEDLCFISLKIKNQSPSTRLIYPNTHLPNVDPKPNLRRQVDDGGETKRETRW